MRNLISLNLEKLIYLFLGIYGVVYLSNAWSPSSYGFFLQHINAIDTGIIWGEPRPIRSDEWAVVTPLTQALVNNDFQQFNATSIYNENLRINYGLPIYDWGMIFKPSMWGYLFLSPAYAYSLQWFLTFALFIIGYFKLFQQIGLKPIVALGLTLIIYFSGYSQFWWNEKGPIFVFFSWLTLVLISKYNLPLLLRLILFYWLATSWFITNLYPPVILSLAFVGGLLFLCFGQYWFTWQRLLGLGLSGLLAIGTALFYLQDYLLQTMQTVYPGSRNASGGSTPIREFLAQFQPFSMYDSTFTPINQNISEIGVVALPFILMGLFHIDYKQLKNVKLDKNILILGAGLVLMFLWMLAPIPASLGKIFLWNNVQPERMEYAAGITLAILVCLIADKITFKISLMRFVLYSCTVTALWLALTQPFFGWQMSGMLDLLLIPVMLSAYVLIKKFNYPIFNSFIILSAFIVAAVNIFFNPIQSAKAIFEQDFAIKKILNQYVNNQNIIAIQGFPGATLNGLGYKSITHVTPIPQLTFWKQKYPDLPEEKFNHTFSRYSHIILNSDIVEPNSPYPDQVHIPLKDFRNEHSILEGKISIEQTAVNLSNGKNLEGILYNIPNGKLKVFSILMGNYQNTSNGILKLRVCAANRCSYGEQNLKDSLDNSFLPITLIDELPILNNRLIYELGLFDSTTDVAIWKVKLNNEYELSPNIRLLYD